MILQIKPTSHLAGKVDLPPSKSYSIRAFIISLCGGVSEIINPSDCDDAKVAISVAKHLGAEIIPLRRNRWRVIAGSKPLDLKKINVKESGTVLRFILPLLSLYNRKASVVGEGTLIRRPNHHLVNVLRLKGIAIKAKGLKSCVPIYFLGGTLKGGSIAIEGSLSSQFISAFLIACPQLAEDTTLFVRGKKIVSTDYITMTQQVLARTGIKVKKVNNRVFKIAGGQRFKGLRNFHVPSDYGLAAFLIAAGILSCARIILKGHFDDQLVQADGKILKFMKRMGIRIERKRHYLKVVGPSQILGGNFSLKDCPDLLPIMTILALFAKGKTRLYDIKHARIKESDRISDLREELLKIGANIQEKENELIIFPYDKYKGNVTLDPHHDHRLAMAFSVLGTKIGVNVKDIECITKSYPDFVKDLKKIGIKYTYFK